MASKEAKAGTRESPWKLKAPPGTSEFEAFRDESLEPPVLVARVGKTELRYQLRCISAKNPVKGWYGLKKGLRGRFGVYVPPVLEAMGLVELEHLSKNNRVRAVAARVTRP